MNTIFYYYVYGPLVLCALYALCFFLVVGIKVCLFFIKPKKHAKLPTSQSSSVKPAPKKRNSVKSIEIDPDYIDRIYVKKSS